MSLQDWDEETINSIQPGTLKACNKLRFQQESGYHTLPLSSVLSTIYFTTSCSFLSLRVAKTPIKHTYNLISTSTTWIPASIPLGRNPGKCVCTVVWNIAVLCNATGNGICSTQPPRALLLSLAMRELGQMRNYVLSLASRSRPEIKSQRWPLSHCKPYSR